VLFPLGAVSEVGTMISTTMADGEAGALTCLAFPVVSRPSQRCAPVDGTDVELVKLASNRFPEAA
jgi:hypothetical protein